MTTERKKEKKQIVACVVLLVVGWLVYANADSSNGERATAATHFTGTLLILVGVVGLVAKPIQRWWEAE